MALLKSLLDNSNNFVFSVLTFIDYLFKLQFEIFLVLAMNSSFLTEAQTFGYYIMRLYSDLNHFKLTFLYHAWRESREAPDYRWTISPLSLGVFFLLLCGWDFQPPPPASCLHRYMVGMGLLALSDNMFDSPLGLY